jgi:hypothetical protein
MTVGAVRRTIRYEKEPIGRFTRYMANGWKFYVYRDHEIALEQELKLKTAVVDGLAVLLRFSDYAIDDRGDIVKVRVSTTSILETFLKTV